MKTITERDPVIHYEEKPNLRGKSIEYYSILAKMENLYKEFVKITDEAEDAYDKDPIKYVELLKLAKDKIAEFEKVEKIKDDIYEMEN